MSRVFAAAPFLCLLLAGPASSQTEAPVCALYGFNPKAAAFQGKTPPQAARQLSSWGVNAVFGGYENPELRKALRGRGIRAFADLPCFVGEEYWKKRPESRPINEVGEPLRKVKWYAGVCPNQEWLRNSVVKRARDLVRRQELDGVWLDFIRYPGHWEVPAPHLEQTCFCPVCLEKFFRETTIAPPRHLSFREQTAWLLANHREEWVRFKTESIASLVAEVSEAVKDASPGALVGYFAVPWTRSEKRGAVIEVLGQDHLLMGKSADVVSPMAYHALLGRPASWITESASAAGKDSGKPVWPIVFVGDKEHTLTPEELRAAADAAWQGGTGGLILFDFAKLEAASRLDELPYLFSACLNR
ncbi:MAG: hypothetical protein HZB91_06395 [Elusimicrobia bacterium]|nr:hypothetical protein [Elusimicrobiota bacterium]